jgi:uncharacterized protein (TIGR00369 family)
MPTADESSDAPPEEAVLRRLRERAEGTDLQIPPPSFEEMSAEIRAYDPEAQTLRVRIPVADRYENPTGVMQGGFVCAALDNVLGPLSYLVAPPSATTQLNVTFLRPVRPEHEAIDVTARFEERAGKQLVFSGTVRTPDGKTAATCTSTCRIL